MNIAPKSPSDQSQPADDAWLYRYWSARTWATEADARNMIRRRIVEENARFSFGAKTDPNLADGLVFVRAAGKQVKLKQPRPEPTPVVRLGSEDRPTDCSTPDVGFFSTDLEDNGTPADVYARFARGDAVVYAAWVDNDKVSKAMGAGIVNGLPDQDGEYDWSELGRRRGSPPPLKIRIGPRGKVTLCDGNHRRAWWESCGHAYLPAWVIDERPQARSFEHNDPAMVYASPVDLRLRALRAKAVVEALGKPSMKTATA